MLFKNGVILTMEKTCNKFEPVLAEAVLVEAGLIVKVGDLSDLASMIKSDAEIIDLQGKTLMPGFIDAHLHFIWGSQYLDMIGLREAKSFAEVEEKLAKYAKDNPHRQWITGLEFSYGYDDMVGKEFHRSMLDKIVNDRPVFFYSGMAHAAWANSKALQLAGIDKDTKDPENGRIVRDKDGNATGWLIEQAAKIVEAKIPKASDDDTLAMLKTAIIEANKLGITRVQSAGFDDEMLPHLEKLRNNHELTLRFTLATLCNPPVLDKETLNLALERHKRFKDNFLDARVMKFFIDGVLESHTAYMPDGYNDKINEHGDLLWDSMAYQSAIHQAQAAGLQIWSHAIGRGAISFALDGYESDIEQSRQQRPRVEHVEIPAAQDLSRFKHINAIASMQPAMIYPKDQWVGMVGVWETRAGTDNLPLAFPIKSLLDHDAAVAFGTDWPIVDLNPFIGIRNAVLRQSRDGEPANGWVPDQRISVMDAINAYTLGAAYAGHREKYEGSICEGKLADLIIISHNPLEIPPDDLADIEVLATYVGGRLVYQKQK
ncbi:amidohydrolase [Bartonella sp. HY406]|uniref:amidohydrolase n=1 Tax=Bartonella sp. HY406 TaxID=2979331 RepID=UPI0021C726EB|nr:amidohydrolase [Bartonella sp. HY406]UXN03618.1 amidohydrolase [Bartonella sp. HY406]